MATTPTSGPPPTIVSPERPHEPKPAPTATPTPPSPGPVKPEYIEVMLAILRAGGYLLLPADTGEWNSNTEDALRRWQEDNGLVATGVIDAATSDRIDQMIAPLANPAPQQTSAPTPAAAAPAEEGSGAPPSAPAATTTAPAGEPNPDGKFGIPGGAQIWKNEADGYWYVVYMVPGTYIPLAWRIESNDDVAAIFGPGNEWKIDRTVSAEEWKTLGVLSFGPSRQLANLSEHPFDAFVANFETEAATRPWLRDPEILALTTRAILEGRTVTDAELAGTSWWKGHTEGERAWIAEYNRDPATAQQKVTDGHNRVRKLMIDLGIANPPEKLVQLLANRLTAGTWTPEYVQSQISKLADPYAPGALDPTVATWVSDLQKQGVTMNTLVENTDKVSALIRTWLGPAFEHGISKEQREAWAGRLRNDPQAEEEIIAELRRKRLALFPEYEDERLSYEDIASTWRGVWQQMWGQAPDETDKLFTQVLRANDLSVAQELLRREGLARNNGTVRDSLISAVAGSDMGSTVRRAV